MPRITKVYTRTGDDGSTGLAGGKRVRKDSLRIETYGTVDETNSFIGAALAAGLNDALRGPLGRIQNELFHVGSELATPGSGKAKRPGPRVEQKHIDALEKLMDSLSEELSPLENFVMPGGTPGAAMLHVARTVCRRAERLAVALARKEKIGEFVVPYLNRLSDALFVMARHENRRRGASDILWDSRA